VKEGDGPQAELEKAIRDFASAEDALRDIIQGSEALASAEAQVDLAFQNVETALEALGHSRMSLSKGAEALGGTASDLHAVASQLRVVLETLQEIDPAEIARVNEETQAELHKVGTRLKQAIDAARADLGVAVEGARGDLDTLSSVVTDARSSVDEQHSAMRRKLDSLGDDLTGAQSQLRELESRLNEVGEGVVGSLQEVVKRQKLTLILAVVIALLSTTAVVLAVAG
jgi:chromosome segregation ATPase